MITGVPTPDTLNYLVLALAAATVVIGGYLVSLVVRYRNLQQDMKLVEQLTNEK